MPTFNVPVYDTDRLSFGPGILFLGPTGATPTSAHDVGAVRAGAELAITRSILEVRQGSGQNLIKQFANVESATLTVNGLEWKLDNWIASLGTGVTESIPGGIAYSMGTDIGVGEKALKFEHRRPNGIYHYVDFWRASPTGEFTLTFGEDLHEFAYAFKALDCVTAWDGTDLTETIKRLLRIREQSVKDP